MCHAAGEPSRRAKKGNGMKTQTFGIEVEMNHITRAKAAQVIAAHFGTSVDYRPGRPYDLRRIPDGTGRYWKVVSDSSIWGPDAEKTEVVSPVCRWEDIETVQALVRKLEAAGARAHTSCGIHIHIGADKHTAKTLRNLVNTVNAKEDLLQQALQIDENRRWRYCAEVDQDFLRKLNTRRPKTLEVFAQLWYGDLNWRSHAACHYDDSRYHLLNLHSVFQKGTVEFRAFNSTLDPDEVKAYIQLCMAINHAALTATSASPTRPVTDNPKYTFRCWLLRLGFIGDEYKTAREHLIKHLPGNAAWRQAS